MQAQTSIQRLLGYVSKSLALFIEQELPAFEDWWRTQAVVDDLSSSRADGRKNVTSAMPPHR